MTTMRRLSDEQLATAVLDITDPMAVEGLSFDRPDPELIPTIVGEYHLPTSDDPIWCCHCRAKRHWNGFVIENGSGSRYLIGSQCGPKYYQLSFAQAKREHSELKQRRGLVTRLRGIVGTSDAVLGVVHDILHSDGLAAIDTVRKAIEKAAGDAFFRLQPFIGGGSLSEAVRVRDYAAEAARTGSSSDQPLYTFESRSIGPLEGTGLIISHGDCRDRLLALRHAIAAVAKLGKEGTDSAGTTVFMNTIRQCEEAHKSAQQAIALARRAPDFFSPENLVRLERWSEQFDTFTLRGKDGAIEVIPKTGKPTVIGALKPVVLPDLPPFSIPTEDILTSS